MSLVGPLPPRGWRLSSVWTLDLRSLACLRISYGLILLLDLASRACDLKAHYTDWGAVPRSDAILLSNNPAYWSLHLISGSCGIQACLFVLAAIASLAMLVGYRTRTATVVAWVMLVSLHSRNAIVLDGGDVYLRCILFWCMFLPWGAYWSWDSRHQLERPKPEVCSVATLGYLCQFSLVYWVAVALKTGSEWRVDGTAVYYALNLEQFTTPLASLLLSHPQCMKMLTFATLTFECLGPFLFWIPGPTRLIGFVGFAALHLGFGSFLYLGLFAIIGALTPIGFLPTRFWNWLEDRLGRPQKTHQTTCRPLSWPTRALLSFLLALLWLWNLKTIPSLHIPLDPPFQIMHFLRLDQKWTMFAPKPLVEDGWYVVEAEQRNGNKIDILRNGAAVDWKKPHGVNAHYRNARWRKLQMNLWDASLCRWRLPFGQYLTRSWNENHPSPQQILRFRIYFMLEVTLPNGIAPVERKLIWSHRCFDYVKD